MKDVCLFMTITQRAYAEEFIKFFCEEGGAPIYSTPCAGTARSKTLDLLGIERTEKTIMFSILTGEQMHRIVQGLTVQMKIDLPDRGVGLAIPLSSIGGTAAMTTFLGQNATLTEREETKKMNAYELIVAIVENGHTDEVMDAARRAGAGGGTVIRAKGTAGGAGVHFLGLSIAEEKEMIFIVSRAEGKNAIMKGIMQEAGVDSPAHALVFSLPVLETAGFRLAETFGEDK